MLLINFLKPRRTTITLIKCLRSVSSTYKIKPVTKCDTNPTLINYLNQVNISNQNFINLRNLCSINEIDSVFFEKVCEETLDSLSEYFEEIIDNSTYLKSADVSYSNGVLTVNLGDIHGTYVINRQTPNKQIWLSSPTSGPKRYDYVNGYWLYKHDGKTLHELLQKEISGIIKNVDFSKCTYSCKV